MLVAPLCLENILKDWSVDNMRKIGHNGYVYGSSVDYDTISVDHILHIHRYIQ